MFASRGLFGVFTRLYGKLNRSQVQASETGCVLLSVDRTLPSSNPRWGVVTTGDLCWDEYTYGAVTAKGARLRSHDPGSRVSRQPAYWTKSVETLSKMADLQTDGFIPV